MQSLRLVVINSHLFQYFRLLHKLFCRDFLVDRVWREHVASQARPALVHSLLHAGPRVVVAQELLVDALRVVRLVAGLGKKLRLSGGENVDGIWTPVLKLFHISSWI